MKNTGRTKSKTQDPWGDPLNWTKENAQPVLHPYGCRCNECQRSIKWVKKYQAYIRRVDR